MTQPLRCTSNCNDDSCSATVDLHHKTVSSHRYCIGRIQPVVATPLTKEVFMGRPAVWMQKLTGRGAMREQARQTVFEYIEHYYNRVSRHSNNGWVTSVEFERLHHQSFEESYVY
jgi:transposase InsO family protein